MNIRSKFIKRLTDDDPERTLLKLVYRARSELNTWFGWLRGSVEFFALNWYDIVPPFFLGSSPKLGNLPILFDGKESEDADFDLRFKISNYRASEVLVGVGLYSDSRVFFREIIKNAFDATKRQIFKECSEKGNTEDYKSYMLRATEHPVIIEVKVSNSKSFDNGHNIKLDIRVVDTGIGIDGKTLNSMKHIGSKYDPLTADYDRIPEWLKPTSSFGIGLQSVFLWTDEFYMVSATRSDNIIRNISLSTPKYGGEIVYTHKSREDESFGTTVHILIEKKLSGLIEGIQENYTGNKNNPLLSTEEWILNRLCHYIQRTFTSDVVPLRYIMTWATEDSHKYSTEKFIKKGEMECIFGKMQRMNSISIKDVEIWFDILSGKFAYWSMQNLIFIEGEILVNSAFERNMYSSDGYVLNK